MTAIALFASTFALVFLLGVQQLNVQHGHQAAAFFTSLFIGLSQLALYKMAYPKEIARAIQLRGALVRKINRAERALKESAS